MGKKGPDGGLVRNLSFRESQGFLQATAQVAERWEAAGVAIGNKVAALSGAPGPATSAVEPSSADGFFQRFTDSAIYHHDSLGTHWVLGAIYAKYLELKGEGGFLGYPVSDELKSADGIGRYTDFQFGSIIWSPETGAHEVHGAIRLRWLELHGSQWELGFPISDESAAADPSSRFSLFEKGLIWWSAVTGAMDIREAVYKHWLLLGGENSYLGLPVKRLETGSIQFQRGTIQLNGSHAFDVSDARIVNTGTIHVDGAAANGWSELRISSNGNYKYTGSMRSTGVLSYDVLITTVFDAKDANGQYIAFAQKGDVEGTLVLGGNRAHTWEEAKFDARIRDNWDALRNAKASSYLKVDFGPGDVAALVATVVGIPLVAIGVVLGAVTWGDNYEPCWTPVTEQSDGQGGTIRSAGVTYVPKGQPCPLGTERMR